MVWCWDLELLNIINYAVLLLSGCMSGGLWVSGGPCVSSWASWWAKLWLSGMYCSALGVEFLSAGKTYGGELLVCNGGYYSTWVLAVYLRVVGVFWWCGGCHPVSHGVGNLVFLCCVLCATLDRNVWAVLYVSVVVYHSQSGVELHAL